MRLLPLSATENILVVSIDLRSVRFFNKEACSELIYLYSNVLCSCFVFRAKSGGDEKTAFAIIRLCCPGKFNLHTLYK